jgi:hypothetical protein
MYSTLKWVVVIVLPAMLHWNCQTNTIILESKLESLFFQADQKDNYRELVAYYNKQKFLKEVKEDGQFIRRYLLFTNRKTAIHAQILSSINTSVYQLTSRPKLKIQK